MTTRRAEDGRPRLTVDVVPWEARAFQGRRAGIVTRTSANIVDFVVTVVALLCGYAAWSAVVFLINPSHFDFPSVPFGGVLGCGGAFLLCYLTVAWATTGRTYGGHLLGLEVVNFRGDRMSWAGALLRAAFCIAFPIGLYWAVVSTTNRSLQDTVLRTSVRYDWPAGRPKGARPAAGPAEPQLPAARPSPPPD